MGGEQLAISGSRGVSSQLDCTAEGGEPSSAPVIKLQCSLPLKSTPKMDGRRKKLAKVDVTACNWWPVMLCHYSSAVFVPM